MMLRNTVERSLYPVDPFERRREPWINLAVEDNVRL